MRSKLPTDIIERCTRSYSLLAVRDIGEQAKLTEKLSVSEPDSQHRKVCLPCSAHSPVQ